jgi:hypothetical protein
LVCKMPHSPARWPPYGLPETSRLLKVNHYRLHMHMKMRLGGYAASSQNTDADRGARGWSRVTTPVHDEKCGLPNMDVYKPV